MNDKMDKTVKAMNNAADFLLATYGSATAPRDRRKWSDEDAHAVYCQLADALEALEEAAALGELNFCNAPETGPVRLARPPAPDGDRSDQPVGVQPAGQPKPETAT